MNKVFNFEVGDSVTCHEFTIPADLSDYAGRVLSFLAYSQVVPLLGMGRSGRYIVTVATEEFSGAIRYVYLESRWGSTYWRYEDHYTTMLPCEEWLVTQFTKMPEVLYIRIAIAS